jgi:hypothetical protein
VAELPEPTGARGARGWPTLSRPAAVSADDVHLFNPSGPGLPVTTSALPNGQRCARELGAGRSAITARGPRRNDEDPVCVRSAQPPRLPVDQFVCGDSRLTLCRRRRPLVAPGLQRVGEPQEPTRSLDARSRSHLSVTAATLDKPVLVWPIGRYRAPNPSETKEKHRWSIHGAQAGARGVLGCRNPCRPCVLERALANDVRSDRAPNRAI